MASSSEFEALEEEVKELLQNYKFKKATSYEPCTLRNIKECLIGIHEELELFNISYIFNPHFDVERNTLTEEALVTLINSFWTLLHHYKNTNEKVARMQEHNLVLEQNNNQLNGMVSRLKEKLDLEKNQSRACVASAQRISDQSDTVMTSLTEARAKVTQLTKQKDSIVKTLQNEVSRYKKENERLQEMLRLKAGSYSPCSDACDSTLVQLRDRDRKQRKIITTLQENNQQLIREVLSLKEEIILTGLSDYKLDGKSKK